MDKKEYDKLHAEFVKYREANTKSGYCIGFKTWLKQVKNK